MHLASHLPKLGTLRLCSTCSPATDVITAAQAAQAQMASGAQTGPLCIHLEGQWKGCWNEPQAVSAALQQLEGTPGSLDPQAVRVVCGWR